jgi:hypothetical protein
MVLKLRNIFGSPYCSWQYAVGSLQSFSINNDQLAMNNFASTEADRFEFVEG